MNLKDCKSGSGLWAARYEILGIAFLVLATLLTIRASDSFGIVAMFVVGLVLIGHRHFCYIGCHSTCHKEGCHSEEGSCEPECTTKTASHKKKEA